MDSKWLRFSKRAKVVIAGVVTADLGLVIAFASGTAGAVLTLVGILSASVPPFLAYWVSE